MVIQFRAETLLAIAAVEQALANARTGTGAVHFKEGRDVVTDQDIAIEDAIRASVEGALGYPVIGEERGGTVPADAPYWLLDPICGTRNFASGIPFFAVNLALVEDGKISIGVVGDGSTGAVHMAELGKGAWTLTDGVQIQLSASADSRIVDFEAWPVAGPERDRAATVVAAAIAADQWDIRCLSSTLALVLVAQGRIAACMLFSAPSLVHVAAGILLASEANALVTDTDGERWRLGSRSVLLSADDRLHSQHLDLLRIDQRLA